MGYNNERRFNKDALIKYDKGDFLAAIAFTVKNRGLVMTAKCDKFE